MGDPLHAESLAEQETSRHQPHEEACDFCTLAKILKGNSPAEAPQDKPKSTVGVQADGHFSRGVELTL